MARGFVTRIASVRYKKDDASQAVVVLSNGGVLALPDDERLAADYADILEDACEDEGPLYLVVEGETLLRVLPTIVGRVLALNSASDGVDVEITNSSTRYRLRHNHPRFSTLNALLQHAFADGAPVTMANDHGLVDVEIAAADEKALLEGFEVLPPDVDAALLKDSARLPPITWADLGAVFADIMSQSCAVRRVGSSCIPFLYPTDWCWTRAHAMTRLIRQRAGLETGKAWTRGHLKARTLNDPDCYVRWGWHVAPLLNVVTPQGIEANYVIDPSMFEQPVPLAEWVAAQGDPNVKVTMTSWDVYNYSKDRKKIKDPSFQKVDPALRQARRALASQIANNGPPPYAHCRL